MDNVVISRTYGEWATTKSNEGRLNEAFNSTPHVFLIFAVSKIQEFKGFARMASSTTNKMGFWKNIQSIKLGGCFKIQWITFSSLSFHRIGNMTNPRNDNELVKKSRDCTELDPKVGGEICKMFEVPYRDPSTPPELFILRGTQNITKDPFQDAINQMAMVDKTQLQNTYEKEGNITDSQFQDVFMMNKQFVNNLLKFNPDLLQKLQKMTNKEYEDFLYKISDSIKSYFKKNMRRDKFSEENSRSYKIQKKERKDSFDSYRGSMISKRSKDRRKEKSKKRDRKKKKKRKRE